MKGRVNHDFYILLMRGNLLLLNLMSTRIPFSNVSCVNKSDTRDK